MRKHFLILMLMALLPLASFAANITILPANIQRTYGDNDIPTQQQTATVEMLNIIGELPNGVTAQNVADALQFIPQEEIDGAPGSYDFTLVTKDNYQTGSLENHTIAITGSAQVQILKKDLADEMIQAITAVSFKGSKWEPTITVKMGNDVIASSNYTVQYGDDTHDNIHRGTGYVKITANSDSYYRGSAEATFTINPLALTTVTVDAIAAQTYTRAEIKPSLTVKGKDANNTQFTLRAEDYTATYTSNTDAGTAKVGLAQTENGDFTFTAIQAANSTITFTINKKDVSSDASIAFVGLVNKDFTGAALTQAENNDLKLNWTQGSGDAQTVTDILASFDLTYSNNTNVGTATITATAKTDAGINYTGSTSATFNILPATITGANIALKRAAGDEPAPDTDQDATYTYDGSAIQPGTNADDGYLYVTLGETELVKGQDYVIVGYALQDGDDNTNASVTDGDNQKWASVTIKGIGNYDAVDNQAQPITVRKTFAIQKKTFTLTATPVSKSYGLSPAGEFQSSNTVIGGLNTIGGKVSYKVYSKNGEEYTLVQEANYTTLDVSNDKYYYTATWAANAEPEQDPDENETYDTQDQVNARANYDMNTLTSDYALITITQAQLIIVPDSYEKIYSAADPNTFTYKVYNGTVAPANEVAIADVNFTTAPALTRVAGEDVKYDTDGETVIGYTISVTNQTGDGAVAAGSYTFTFQTGTLTINPFPITVTANPQTILYGSTPTTTTAYNSWVKTVNAAGEEENGTQLTVTFSPAATVTGLIDRDALGLSLTWTGDNHTLGSQSEKLIPAITNKNFKPTYVKGSVEVKGEVAIDLFRSKTGANATTIASYDGKYPKVNIKGGELKANYWYTLVLPFKVKVRDISTAFGYAVVDVPNTANANEEVVSFKLKVDNEYIDPNTLIMIKIDQPRDLNTNAAQFTLTAETPIVNAPANTVADAAGNKYYVSYDAIELEPTENDKRWYLYEDPSQNYSYNKYYSVGARTSNWGLASLSGYFDATAGQAARVYVQEADGTITAISAAEIDVKAQNAEGWYNLNGVKLNAAPTQKGVYIQNGKKIVVK